MRKKQLNKIVETIDRNITYFTALKSDALRKARMDDVKYCDGAIDALRLTKLDFDDNTNMGGSLSRLINMKYWGNKHERESFRQDKFS